MYSREQSKRIRQLKRYIMIQNLELKWYKIIDKYYDYRISLLNKSIGKVNRTISKLMGL